MAEKRLTLGQAILMSLVTGFFTIASGMILFYWQKAEPKLVYSVQEALPFAGSNQNISIHHVKILNSGNTMVEDVVCHLSFGLAIVVQAQVKAEPTINWKGADNQHSYVLEVENLNSREVLDIYIQVSSHDKLVLRPKISLRGKDVVGVEGSGDIKKQPNFIFIVGLSIVGGFIAGMIFLAVILRKYLPSISFSFEKPDDTITR